MNVASDNLILSIFQMFLVFAVTLVLLPTIIVAMGVSLRKPGELLEGLLEPVSHGSEMANHAGFTINFTLMSFTIYGTAVFTTVFFIIHCVIITDELKFLHKMIGDAIDTGRIWDNVMVRFIIKGLTSLEWPSILVTWSIRNESIRAVSQCGTTWLTHS